MILVGVAGQPHNHAAGVVLPVRSVQSREGRNEIDPAIVVDHASEGLDLRALGDEPKIVPNPLHQRAGDRHASLEGVVGRLSLELECHGGDEAVFGLHDVAPRVHEQKAARPVRVLRLARPEAGLTHQGRLLVPQDSGHRYARDGIQGRASIDFAAGSDLRQDLPRYSKGAQQLRVPVKSPQTHQLSAAGVGRVRNVQARQVPKQEGIDIAEHNLARFGLLARARDMVQQPADLQRAEVGRQRQPGRGAEPVRSALAREFGDVVSHARILPDQRIGQGPPGLAIPQHGGLALVGDTQRRKVAGPQAALPHCLGNRLPGPEPDLLGIVFHPSGLRVDLLVLPLRAGNDPPGPVENQKPRAGSALIDRSNEVRHASLA